MIFKERFGKPLCWFRVWHQDRHPVWIAGFKNIPGRGHVLLQSVQVPEYMYNVEGEYQAHPDLTRCSCDMRNGLLYCRRLNNHP